MKKYFFGIFAIVLAIGFSAFTVKPGNDASQETSLYWYDVYNVYLGLQGEVIEEIKTLEVFFPSSNFNIHGEAGVPFEYGRETNSPNGNLIAVIYKVN